MADNPRLPDEDPDNFYTLVPEQGLCLIEDAIINLRRVAMIRKTGDKTLVYIDGSAEPLAFPSDFFDKIREAVFLADEYDDDDEEEEEKD